MRTRQEIIDIIAKILIQKKVEESTWSDLVTAVQGIKQTDRDNLVRLLGESKEAGAGKILKDALYDNAKTRAFDEANQLLADDLLSLAELDRIL